MTNTLTIVAGLAAEAGAPALVVKVEALAERLGAGRSYVVCVGQFRRGNTSVEG